MLKSLTEDGKSLAVLELKRGAAPAFRVTLDLATGDLVRAELQELVDGVGALPKSLTFEDWREVEGLRLPGRIVSEDDGTGRVVSEWAGRGPRALAPSARSGPACPALGRRSTLDCPRRRSPR